MRKVILLALIFLGVIYACNKGTEASKVNPVTSSSNQDVLGSLHNNGLRSLLNSAKIKGSVNIPSSHLGQQNATRNITMSSGTSDNSASSLLEASKNLLLQDPSFSSQQFTIDASTTTAIDQLINDLGQNSVKARWSSSISQQTVLNVVSTRERMMINEITAVFNSSLATTPTVPNNYLAIKSKLAAIRNKYINTTFLPNEGELFSGILAIAESSNEFWSGEGAAYVNTIIQYDITAYGNGNQFALIKDPVRDQMPFITADCIGYLAGWASAAYSEWYGGGLSIKNENHRIGQGLIGAVAASTGVLLKASARRPFLGLDLPKDSFLLHIDTIRKKPVF